MELVAADEFGLAPMTFYRPAHPALQRGTGSRSEVLPLRQIGMLSDPAPHTTLGSQRFQGTLFRPLINRIYCVMAMTCGLTRHWDVIDEELVDAIATAECAEQCNLLRFLCKGVQKQIIVKD